MMPNNPDPATESPAFLMHDLARLLRSEFERRIAGSELGVTPIEGRILITLAMAGPLRQHQLAERLGVARMTLTGVLARLERAGLVTRHHDPEDGRARIVALTAPAQTLVPTIRAIGQEVRTVARGDMDEAAWDSFLAHARQARQNLLAATRRRSPA
ncbi:MAG: transcriptional regulator [Rhodobacteraceae bacterium HLUCCA12]|nr:MAG: transcriptional regulator [Rhodobacteraceae bacterium HLUCCA12]